jgi:lipopolysaccharide/colanic/teichoic acid biosynthesis glycosyltransferase
VERVSELPRLSGLALPARVLETVRPARESAISRGIQVLLCLIAVALLSPVMLAVAVAVRCSSRGPVCYRGERVGKDERVFHILKFRTLVADAEQRIGARLLKEEDQVYTPIGKFLKKWKLDELPQLLNVIRGDMSLVGPRPVRPIFLETFKREIPNYALRFRVRPGATGLAQLRGGYWTEPRNKLRYELVYIRNQSLWFDLWLMALTFVKIFNRFVTTGAVLAGLFLFASLFPTSLYPWLYVSIFGTKVNLAYLAIAFLGAWMLARKTYSNHLAVYKSAMYWPMAVFVLIGLCSALFSADPETALRGTGYYLATGFVVAVALMNTRLTVGTARSAATLVGFACFLLSLLGLFELALIKHSMFGAGDATGMQTAVSIKATFATSTVLSAYLVLGFPLLLCQLIHARTRDGRDFWLVATTVAFTSILLTQNLFGLLALLLACAVFLAVTSSRAVPLLVCLFLVPVLLFGSWGHPGGSGAVYQSVRAKAAQEWKALGSVPLRQLALGSGPKTLDPRAEPIPGVRPALVRLASGNTHLSLMLETGALGWLTMLGIIAVALRLIYRGARRAADPYVRSLCWAIFSSGLGFLVSMSGFNAFYQISLQVLFWGLLGLGLGMVIQLTGGRRARFTVWRFGDERPRKIKRKARARRQPGAFALDPSHGAGLDD